MSIPAEFTNRVYKTKVTGTSMNLEKLSKITEQWPGSEIDVLYESGKPIVVLVFETQEDCLAFTLKYGDKHV